MSVTEKIRLVLPYTNNNIDYRSNNIDIHTVETWNYIAVTPQ